MKKNKEQTLNIIMSLSLLIMLIMAMLPIVKIHWDIAPYIFAVGAAGAMVVRIFEVYKGKNLRLRRLNRIGKVSAMCYVLSAFFMFYEQAQPTDWLGFLTAGAVLQVYISFMTASEEKKEAEKGK
ncbi:MAG: hypothetical protein PHR45_07450 [Muribaculaceae bacterium]|nr:hypothetical protein [Muribaculaceae bacterium]